MPTSTAADRVADALGIKCYETPTGWKFFGNLLDAGLVHALRRGELRHRLEPRAREGRAVGRALLALDPGRDGQVGRRGRARPLARFGRSYYQRHDYEGLDAAAAARDDVGACARSFRPCRARRSPASRVERADDFGYTDPVDGSTTARQGVRIFLADGSRVVLRLSGTGTAGATLAPLHRALPRRRRRERHRRSPRLAQAAASARLLRLRERFGTDEPTVVT